MSILSRTLADKIKLGLVDVTVEHPWLWSWMEQEGHHQQCEGCSPELWVKSWSSQNVS